MHTAIPIQHSEAGRRLKEFLHTPDGAELGFALGISGFNNIQAIVKDRLARVVKIINTYNSRVDRGAALISSLVAGSALGGISSPAAPLYVALSTSTITPAAGDTTLSGETAASGLARALGAAGSYVAPVALDGAASFIVTKTFTNSSGGQVTIRSAALFDAASSGNMFVEGNLSSAAVLEAGYQLTINWTVNN